MRFEKLFPIFLFVFSTSVQAAGPGLKVEAVSFPKEVDAGQSFIVEVAVKNTDKADLQWKRWQCPRTDYWATKSSAIKIKESCADSSSYFYELKPKESKNEKVELVADSKAAGKESFQVGLKFQNQVYWSDKIKIKVKKK